jgi:triosephosphate isomerase
VHEDNVADFMKDAMVDGFLVGRSSLDPAVFEAIVHASVNALK